MLNSFLSILVENKKTNTEVTNFLLILKSKNAERCKMKDDKAYDDKNNAQNIVVSTHFSNLK